MAINVSTNPLPPSGPLSMSTLRANLKETNSGSVSLGELYRYGAYVPNASSSASVPTSGAISISNFYNVNVKATATITGVEQNLNVQSQVFGGDFYTGLKKTLVVNGYIISQNAQPALNIPASAGSSIKIQLTGGGIFGTGGGGGGGGYWYAYDCSYTASLGGGVNADGCDQSCANGPGGYCRSGCYGVPIYGTSGDGGSFYLGPGANCPDCAVFVGQTCYAMTNGGGGDSGSTALYTLSNIQILGTGALIYGGGGGGGGGGAGGREGGPGLNIRGYSCAFFGWQYCESCDRSAGQGYDFGGQGGQGGNGAGFSWDGVNLNYVGTGGYGGGGSQGDGGAGTGGTGGGGGGWGSIGGYGFDGNPGGYGPGGNCAGGSPGGGGSAGGPPGGGGASVVGWNRVEYIENQSILGGAFFYN